MLKYNKKNDRFLKMQRKLNDKKNSNIPSVDQGINQKNNGELLQQSEAGVAAVVCPFLVDALIT